MLLFNAKDSTVTPLEDEIDKFREQSRANSNKDFLHDVYVRQGAEAASFARAVPII